MTSLQIRNEEENKLTVNTSIYTFKPGVSSDGRARVFKACLHSITSYNLLNDNY